jgi:hypothetical protein
VHSYRYILSVVIFVSACSDSSNTSHSTTPPKPKIQLSEVQPAKQIVKPFVKYEDKMLAGDTIKLDFTVLAPSAVVDYMDSSVGVFKSKYETTREWTERFSNSIKEPYYETLQLSDKIAFKMEVRDILEYQYNAPESVTSSSLASITA